MSDVNFVVNWKNEDTQCKNCKSFKEKDGKTVCVPEDKTFEQALEEYGNCPPEGHCDYFEEK
jgi:hypothetical protein